MKNIVVITTGGTIAMRKEKESGVKLKDPEELKETIPLLSQYANVEMKHLFNKPSPHITLHDMYTLAKTIQSHLDQGADGIVVTHGTDTLEETAYFLDLTIDTNKPIIVTGAMRSLNELGADGPYNLVNAVRVAVHPKAAQTGTLVVFNDEIHTAKMVTKTHTNNISTFQSPSVGPIGQITKKHILFHQMPVREPKLPLLPPRAHVILLKAVAGMDDTFIRFATKVPVDGIVIEAFGQGNLPPAMLPGIKEAIRKNIPIVLVSRCFHGLVQDTYAYEGGGKHLKEMGIIFSNGISGPKARIKLTLALSITKNPAELRKYFQMD